jgi:translation initiation factor IF-3
MESRPFYSILDCKGWSFLFYIKKKEKKRKKRIKEIKEIKKKIKIKKNI